MPSNFRRCGLLLPERFPEPFKRDGLPYRPAMAKTIDNRLGDAENLHWNAFDSDRGHIVRQQRFREADDTDGRMPSLSLPIPCADRHPYSAWKLIGQSMKRKCGDEADNAFRNALGGLSETVVGVEWGIW